jgi:large subunit ribosomal protein L13
MKQTPHLNPQTVDRKWVHFDASGKVVGRLATEISRILRGKDKPTFSPHVAGGDHVVVTNVDKMVFTGNKIKQKFYHKHSGYMGGLHSTRADVAMEKNPERVLFSAVKGMLPKNKLSNQLLKHLRVYAGPEHGQEAQKPVAAQPRTADA